MTGNLELTHIFVRTVEVASDAGYHVLYGQDSDGFPMLTWLSWYTDLRGATLTQTPDNMLRVQVWVPYPQYPETVTDDETARLALTVHMVEPPAVEMFVPLRELPGWYLTVDGVREFFDWFVGEVNKVEWKLCLEWFARQSLKLVVVNAGGACPFQATGTWDGWDWYLRYRHGTVTLDIGKAEKGFIEQPYWHALLEVTEEDDGVLSLPVFAGLFMKLADMLKPTDFVYQFLTVLDSKPGEGPIMKRSPGATAEKAYNNLMEYELDRAKVFMCEPRQFDCEPVNQDNRMYPVEPPEFLNISRSPN